MGEQWYCMVVGQEVGPITTEDLAAMLELGQIDADDTVRAGTSGTWRPVREVLDVAPLLADGAATATAAEPTWFCRMLDSEFGPYTFDEVRELAAQEQLAPDDEIREGRSGPWRTASTLPGLFSESAVRQRTLEIEQARSEAEQRKKERKKLRRVSRRRTEGRNRPDELLDGLDDLDDAEKEAFTPSDSAFSVGQSLPSDPAARAAMLKRLDAEYERLRSQLTNPTAGERDPRQGVPQAPGVSTSPLRPASPPSPPNGQSGMIPPRSAPVIPVQNDPHRDSPAPPHSPPAPVAEQPAAASFGSSRSPAADLMRDMAAAQLRAAQPPARAPSRAAYPASSSGGSGFDLSSFNLSGKTLGIAGAVVGVLVLGYFVMNSSLFESFGAGAVYDETVKLYDEFKKVADKDATSSEFTSFHGKFKTQQQQLLKDIGSPSRGSTADEVRRAILALGTVIEAQRRPEITKAEREPFMQTLDQQMKKLKQTFGR